MTGGRQFDRSYVERVELGDGTEAELRLVAPCDRELLRQAFDRLSAQSRYLRFFSAKAALSEGELDFLTDTDGENHVAVGAVTTGVDGRPEGLGVARFLRRPERPELADAAVTVADHVQGLGLGAVLLRRLAGAAQERGVERFALEFLERNQRARKLLEAFAPGTRFECRGGTVRAEIPLASYPSAR